MERLCERPGCSEPASVSYGMRPADLVFWLDTLNDGDDQSHGVLCRRHADSMVVPRNWTLDDIRDPELHLFRPPIPAPRSGRARRRTPRGTPVDQLELGIDDEAVVSSSSPPAPDSADHSADHAPADHVPADHAPADDPVAAEAEIDPWTPAFDSADDLDGLLAARSPLLARAFRGAERPRPA